MKLGPWRLFSAAVVLAGCVSNPDQTVFVMPAPASVNSAAPTSADGLAMNVRPVILPDYLDTTDLVTRTGQYDIGASRTGRWGERLSRGVTRSLAASLCDRLHGYIVTDGPAVQIEVTINAFDVTPATSALEASWTIIWPGDGRPPAVGHGTFTTPIAKTDGDVAVVAAMAGTVADLSNAIAVTTRAGATAHWPLASRK